MEDKTGQCLIGFAHILASLAFSARSIVSSSEASISEASAAATTAVAPSPAAALTCASSRPISSS